MLQSEFDNKVDLVVEFMEEQLGEEVVSRLLQTEFLGKLDDYAWEVGLLEELEE